MSKISISYYRVSIIDDKKTYLSPAESKIGDLLYDYCIKFKTYSNKEELKKVFLTDFFEYFEEKIDNKNNYYGIHSILKTGNYGTDGELVSLEKEEFKSKGRFSNTDAIAMPFGWALYYNSREKFSILAIQHNGLHNILDLVKTILKEIVKDIANGASIIIKPFIPDYYFTQLIDKRQLCELQIVKSINTSDVSDIIDVDGKKEIFAPKVKNIYYNPLLDKKVLKKVFQNNDIDAILEFDNIADENEYVENIIIKDKSGKSLNFNRIHNTRISVDISSEVEKLSGSEHPTPLSLFKAIDSHVMEYLQYYKISVDNYKQQARSYINKPYKRKENENISE